MDSTNRAPAELEPKENVALGIVGELLFSLAGALCYFLLSRVGYIATISALVGAYCACFGYGLFAHKKGFKDRRDRCRCGCRPCDGALRGVLSGV